MFKRRKEKAQRRERIKETLEKQLQLLSERSKDSTDDRELAELSCEMVRVASLLRPLL